MKEEEEKKLQKLYQVRKQHLNTRQTHACTQTRACPQTRTQAQAHTRTSTGTITYEHTNAHTRTSNTSTQNAFTRTKPEQPSSRSTSEFSFEYFFEEAFVEGKKLSKSPMSPSAFM